MGDGVWVLCYCNKTTNFLFTCSMDAKGGGMEVNT